MQHMQSVQRLNDGQMSYYGLLQANDGKMLVNDGEMRVALMMVKCSSVMVK